MRFKADPIAVFTYIFCAIIIFGFVFILIMDKTLPKRCEIECLNKKVNELQKEIVHIKELGEG